MKKKVLVLMMMATMVLSMGCGETKGGTNDKVSVNDGNETTDQGKEDAIDQGTQENNEENEIVTLEEVMNHPVGSAKDFWIMEEDGEGIIYEYAGDEKIVVFPEEVEGIKVTAIDCNYRKMTAIRFPDSLVEIDSQTLFVNKSVQVVVFGEGLKKICNMSFASCDGLREVKLNEGLEEIEYQCFMFCPNLKSVYVPESVTFIDGSSSFKGNAEDFVLKGKSGSYAETYANENDIPFVAVD